MSNKHDTSPEAVILRENAREWGEHIHDKPKDPHDRESQARWNKLKRSAIAYAKLALAGQCIPAAVAAVVLSGPPAPPAPSVDSLYQEWYRSPCPKGCPPGRCNTTDSDCSNLSFAKFVEKKRKAAR